MSITAADHKTSSDKHGAFAFGETNSNCVKRPRSGGCKSVVEDSASSCMNCSTDDFARCCNDHCFAPGDRLAVAARAQLVAHGRQKQTMCSARRTIVLSQHLLAASHVAAMISRSSDEWKEAHLYLACRTHGSTRAYLPSRLGSGAVDNTGKLEHTSTGRTRHERRAHPHTTRVRATNQQAHTNDWFSALFCDETAITGAHRRFARPHPPARFLIHYSALSSGPLPIGGHDIPRSTPTSGSSGERQEQM